MYYDSDNDFPDERKIFFAKRYELDPDKIQTVADVREVLRAFNVRIRDNNPNYERVKSFLKESPSD